MKDASTAAVLYIASWRKERCYFETGIFHSQDDGVIFSPGFRHTVPRQLHTNSLFHIQDVGEDLAGAPFVGGFYG